MFIQVIVNKVNAEMYIVKCIVCFYFMTSCRHICWQVSVLYYQICIRNTITNNLSLFCVYCVQYKISALKCVFNIS